MIDWESIWAVVSWRLSQAAGESLLSRRRGLRGDRCRLHR